MCAWFASRPLSREANQGCIALVSPGPVIATDWPSRGMPVMAGDVARDLDPATCLSATTFIDCEHPAIVAAARAFDVETDPVARAVAAFEFVQDGVEYEFMAHSDPQEYVASHVLAQQRGFCIPKAVLLCALGRALGVPTALVLSDLTDHTLPPRITDVMGTNTMYQHGLNAFHLDGQWVLADASLSAGIVNRKRYRPIAFDGASDALHSSTRLDGTPHAHYSAFHGLYPDLPYDEVMTALAIRYAHVDPARITDLHY